MREVYGGIYYVEGKTWFSTQVVVTGELNCDTHMWLKGLSGNLKKGDIWRMLDERNHMTEKADRELADSVLEVTISANRKIIDELIGDESMYEALMEIREDAKIAEERKKGIQITVKSLKDFGVGKEDIRKTIIKNYGLSERDVDAYL